jgi:predicted dehydrogenase
MHSPGNAVGLRNWAQKTGAGRVEVADQWPGYTDGDRPEAVIVANAARSHFPATTAALLAGVPTLVEKPFALTAVDAGLLVDMAEKFGVPLCAGHVIRFARYVQAFADDIARSGSIKKINFTWADPATEIRHGEQKRYDPSISIIHDVFPHILSLLRVLTVDPVRFNSVTVERGGAKVRLDLQAGEFPCAVVLERNAPKRCRMIQVETVECSLELDFTVEPGCIRSGGHERVGDPEWGRAPGPLQSMLKGFLAAAAAGKCDDMRLSPLLGLEACRIMDLAGHAYRTDLAKWMSARLERQIDEDLRYALAELVAGSEAFPLG